MDPELLQKQISELKAENERLKASRHDDEVKQAQARHEAEQKAHAETVAKAAEQAKALQTKLDDQGKAIEALQASVKEVEAKRAELEKNFSEATAELAKVEADKKDRVRVDLVKADLQMEEPEAKAFTDSLKALSDDQFKAHVEVLKASVTVKKPEQSTSKPAPAKTGFKHVKTIKASEALAEVETEQEPALSTAGTGTDDVRKAVASALRPGRPNTVTAKQESKE